MVPEERQMPWHTSKPQNLYHFKTDCQLRDKFRMSDLPRGATSIPATAGCIFRPVMPYLSLCDLNNYTIRTDGGRLASLTTCRL